MEYVIDAKGERLGRLASRIAVILQVKFDPGYAPRIAGFDRVTVKNAAGILVSGRKAEEKVYFRHTGYMGHLRARKFHEAFRKSPEEVLRSAIWNMLPKNRLRRVRLKRLIIER